MGAITLKKQSAVSVELPQTDQLRLFVDSADDILKTKDSSGTVRPSGVGTADELATTGSPVDVSASAPPIAGDVLTATSPTAAIWQASGIGTQTAIQVGPTTYAAVIGDFVRINVAAGAVLVNLPTAVGNACKEITVKLVSVATYVCTVDGLGSQTIDGALVATLSTDYEWIVLRSDGANWMQVG